MPSLALESKFIRRAVALSQANDAEKRFLHKIGFCLELTDEDGPVVQNKADSFRFLYQLSYGQLSMISQSTQKKLAKAMRELIFEPEYGFLSAMRVYLLAQTYEATDWDDIVEQVEGMTDTIKEALKPYVSSYTRRIPKYCSDKGPPESEEAVQEREEAARNEAALNLPPKGHEWNFPHPMGEIACLTMAADLYEHDDPTTTYEYRWQDLVDARKRAGQPLPVRPEFEEFRYYYFVTKNGETPHDDPWWYDDASSYHNLT